MSRLRSVVAVAVLFGASLGSADPGGLKVNFRRDLALTAAAAAVALGLDAAPLGEGCRICAPSEFDSSARNIFKLRNPAGLRDARRASDYLASYAIPVGAIAVSGFGSLRDGSGRVFLEDLVVLGQAVAISADLNSFAKGFVGRPRPGEADREGASGRSFYSAHTSRAFTFAVAAGTIFTIRGRRSAPWVWAAGLTLAAGVGYLRVASDAHWLTDVGAGAAIGSAVGFAVPWFFHRRHGGAPSRFEPRPAPGGVAFSF